jgi:putative spermidine/putrescine transport system permease protein
VAGVLTTLDPTVPGAAVRRPGHRRGLGGALPAVPLLVVLGLLFVVPVAVVVGRSFTYPDGATLANYRTALTDPVARQFAWNTVRTALVVSVASCLLGYTYAYAMYRAGRTVRVLLLFCALLPFWTSLLVRSYAWTVLLRDRGVLNELLLQLGVIDAPLPLLRTSLAVTLGMTQILLPFVILPVYAAMTRFPPDLALAARSLGASRRRVFWEVFLPATMPGLVAGAVLAFILAVGYYITPVLLGGPGDQPIAVLIENAVQQRGDWGTAGALSTLVVVLVLALLALGWRFLAKGLLGARR